MVSKIANDAETIDSIGVYHAWWFHFLFLNTLICLTRFIRRKLKLDTILIGTGIHKNGLVCVTQFYSTNEFLIVVWKFAIYLLSHAERRWWLRRRRERRKQWQQQAENDLIFANDGGRTVHYYRFKLVVNCDTWEFVPLFEWHRRNKWAKMNVINDQDLI